MTSFKFTSENPTPIRLDLFLVAQNISPSRSQIARWIKEGGITVNGVLAKAATLVEQDHVVEVNPPEIKPSELKAEDIPLNVLYEDKDLIVLNKSSEMVVHPGAGHQTGTLVHALLAHSKGLSNIGGVERPGIVHRLDKGTSGIMLIAKNDKAHIELSRQFKDHEIKKVYCVLVYGSMKKKEGTLESAIGRSLSDRKKFSVNPYGKKAITHYRVLSEGSGVSLLEINLETGRTHQIRVHLTHEGFSVVGDPLYGGNAKKVRGISKVKVRMHLQKLTHPLLHARTLEFKHPRTKKKMKFTADLPQDFKEAIQYSLPQPFRGFEL